MGHMHACSLSTDQATPLQGVPICTRAQLPPHYRAGLAHSAPCPLPPALSPPGCWTSPFTGVKPARCPPVNTPTSPQLSAGPWRMAPCPLWPGAPRPLVCRGHAHLCPPVCGPPTELQLRSCGSKPATTKPAGTALALPTAPSHPSSPTLCSAGLQGWDSCPVTLQNGTSLFSDSSPDSQTHHGSTTIK